MKRCSKCNEIKKVNLFHKNQKICKNCKIIYYKKRYSNKKEYILKQNLDYILENPWVKFLKNIRYRCNNHKSVRYNRYGGRGIKCLITKEEIKKLWYRDKAYKMKKPSIDRIDNNGHYEYSNCQFLEMKEHNIKSCKSLKRDKLGRFKK